MDLAPGTGNELLRAAEELLAERKMAAALQKFDRAELAGAAPNQCAAGRWQAWMLLGDFDSAWFESDAIQQRCAPDSNRLWNGEAIEGKRIIVRCLHGLGDAVQMLRYLPLLRAQCIEVVTEVPPRMLPLAPSFAGIGRVITWGEQAPAVPPNWDVQVEIMELPYLLRTTVPDLPVAESYLHLPDGIKQRTALIMGAANRPRVGIVWSASEWDPTRLLPIDCLARLLAVPGIEFWNLQGGRQHELAKKEKALSRVLDAAPLGEGLAPLAASIAKMDLVITVDTLAAHLAGALGRNAWVLLQQRADWRWMHARDNSPWYPTLRLFRQTTQDDWTSLTTHICETLEEWMKERN